MIVALTGGTGFLGQHVLAALVAAGHRVRALARRPQPDCAGVDWVAGALDAPESLAALVAGAQAVVHVAGVVNAPDAAAFDAGNRIGTQAMVDAARAAGVARFIHVSSLAARLPALSHYGASKAAAEAVVRASGLTWQIVRPPAIYGPGDMDNLELFRLARRGFMPMPPEGRLSLIHAQDMAALIVAMVEKGESGAIHEADDGRPGGWGTREFATAIADAVGARPIILALPPVAIRLGAWADRLVRGANARLTPDRAAYFCHPDWVIDAALRPPSGLWTPQMPTPEGLKATALWYQEAGLLR